MAIVIYTYLTFNFTNLKLSLEENSEIVTLREHTISLQPHFYTPRNSSSTCNATPPIISKMQPTTGIVDSPNVVLIADSPIQPKTPRTIMMVGGVRAVTIPTSLAIILVQPPLKQFFRQRDGSSSPLQKDISSNSQKQNQERARLLNSWVDIPFLPPQISNFSSCSVTKKQNASPTKHICHASNKCIGRTVFSYFRLIKCELCVSLQHLKDTFLYIIYIYIGYVFFHILFYNLNNYTGGLLFDFNYLKDGCIFWATPLPFTNREKKCNGRIKPGNSCETNAERGKYGETIHHLEAIYKIRKKKILRLWGKYIRLLGKQGETDYWGKKEKLWRKKIQTRTGTGKKVTSYLTSTGDFCSPFKNLLSTVSQGYFSIFSQDTHTFPLSEHSLFSPMNQVYVLKTTLKKTVMPKIRRLGGMFANATTIQSTLRRFSCCC